MTLGITKQNVWKWMLANLLIVIILSLFGDLCGRVFGIPRPVSMLIVKILLATGVLTSIITTIADKKHRVMSILILIIPYGFFLYTFIM